MRQRQVSVRAVPLGYTDPNPNRARFDRGVRDALNAGIGVTVLAEAPSTPDTEFGVLHPALGRKATEFEIVSQDKPGRLYASSRSKWTHRISFFKYDQAGGRLRIRVR